ncbi:hypothetical protein GCM10028784_33750 [Myceligenerans cantabricum]
MSTFDTAFTATPFPTSRARAAARRWGPRATGAANPNVREGERDRAVSRVGRASRRRQDAARRDRDARQDAHLERIRDNAAATHPLGLR